MNGLLGLNVRTLGVSRDQILSAVRQLGCAWVLVQDDPDLIAPLKALGVKTIYRQSGDETLSLDPATFVQTRAEKGADYVYLTNELDPTPEVLAYTMECMKYADQIGVKCVALNLSTDRSSSQWATSRDVLRYTVAHGHATGVHVYQRAANSPQSYTWLAYKREIGGLWLVTEYAFYVDAYHGYRGVLSPVQYGIFLDNTFSQFQHEQMPVLLFSGDNWPANEQGKASGFGVLDNPAMIAQLAQINAKYVWSGIPVTPPPTVYSDGTNPAPKVIDASDGLKLRATPSLSGVLVRVMAYREVVTVYGAPVIPAEGYYWQRVTDSKGLVGWSANFVDGKSAWVDPASSSPAFSFHAPFAQYKIVSHFNDPRDYSKIAPDKKQLHEGVDFEPADGVTCDPVVHIGAACKVVQVSVDPPGYGNFILVDFGNGFSAVYAHFSEIYVKAGQQLMSGQIVGLMGATGNASEPHVHFTLSNPSIGLDGYVFAKVVDPAQFLAK